jgi:uncharacterized membrane protein
MLQGAWPIFGFCGLDVLLFYVMFRLNYRSARMFERIRLLPDELIVERHDARWAQRELELSALLGCGSPSTIRPITTAHWC